MTEHDAALPHLDWKFLGEFEPPIGFLCIEILADENDGIVRWCGPSVALAFKDARYNIVGKRVTELSPEREREQIHRNFAAMIDGRADGKIAPQNRIYVDRFGNEFTKEIQSVLIEGRWYLSCVNAPATTGSDTIDVMLKVMQHMSQASSNSQVIQLGNDYRNQSTTAGRDAAAHGGSVSINTQTLLIVAVVGLVVALAVVFGRGMTVTGGGKSIEVTPAQGE